MGGLVYSVKLSYKTHFYIMLYTEAFGWRDCSVDFIIYGCSTIIPLYTTNPYINDTHDAHSIRQ